MKKLILFLIIILISSYVYAEECTYGERKDCGPKDESGKYTSTGQCQIGIQRCINGSWSVCLGAVYPSEEVCGDNIDNDCNGEADEICECSVGEARQCGETDIGACQYGIEYCIKQKWSGECKGAVYPAEEICDQIDNDCDSTIDEDCGNITAFSCFNNIKDGDELGVDCGGSCPIKCLSCPEGEIKRSCYCNNVIYDSGYCCNNNYQQEPCEARKYLGTKPTENYTILTQQQVSQEAYIPRYVYLIVLLLLISAIWFYVRKVMKPKKVVEIPIHEKPSFKVKIEEKKTKVRPSRVEKELEKIK